MCTCSQISSLFSFLFLKGLILFHIRCYTQDHTNGVSATLLIPSLVSLMGTHRFHVYLNTMT